MACSSSASSFINNMENDRTMSWAFSNNISTERDRHQINIEIPKFKSNPPSSLPSISPFPVLSPSSFLTDLLDSPLLFSNVSSQSILICEVFMYFAYGIVVIIRAYVDFLVYVYSRFLHHQRQSHFLDKTTTGTTNRVIMGQRITYLISHFKHKRRILLLLLHPFFRLLPTLFQWYAFLFILSEDYISLSC